MERIFVEGKKFGVFGDVERFDETFGETESCGEMVERFGEMKRGSFAILGSTTFLDNNLKDFRCGRLFRCKRANSMRQFWQRGAKEINSVARLTREYGTMPLKSQRGRSSVRLCTRFKTF